MDKRLLDKPILITGCARSGTSMTAGIVDMCGAYGGLINLNKTRNNPTGMRENIQIVNSVVKPYLKSIGADPMCQKNLPDIAVVKSSLSDELVDKIRHRVTNIIVSQGYDKKSLWYNKCPKMALIWPLWNAMFPDATWIIVRRDVEDIVRSCLRTSFMRAYTNKSGWILWAGEHEKRFEEMIDAKLKVYEIWPQRMINGDFKEIQNVINAIGLNWDSSMEDKVRAFVEPKLWGKGQNRHGKFSN